MVFGISKIPVKIIITVKISLNFFWYFLSLSQVLAEKIKGRKFRIKITNIFIYLSAPQYGTLQPSSAPDFAKSRSGIFLWSKAIASPIFPRDMLRELPADIARLIRDMKEGMQIHFTCRYELRPE